MLPGVGADTIKAEAAFSRPRSFSHRGIAEKCGRTDPEPISAARFKVSWKAASPSVSDMQFIQSAAGAAAAAGATVPDQGGEKKRESCPLDCAGIKVTAWR